MVQLWIGEALILNRAVIIKHFFFILFKRHITTIWLWKKMNGPYFIQSIAKLAFIICVVLIAHLYSAQTVNYTSNHQRETILAFKIFTGKDKENNKSSRRVGHESSHGTSSIAFTCVGLECRNFCYGLKCKYCVCYSVYV